MAECKLRVGMLVQGLLILVVGVGSAPLWAQRADESCQDRPYCVGTVANHEMYAAWDIDIQPDGGGLPDGSGDAKTGQVIYVQQCASCHGENAMGGVKLNPKHAGFPALAAAESADPLNATEDWPTKTIGTYWPYATTVFDYVRRTMPFTTPQSLSDDEVYSLVTYLLVQNGIVSEDTVISSENLAEIAMPNRDGFVCDSRPDTFNERCMNDCAVPGDENFKEGEVATVVTTQADCMTYQ